MTLRLLARTIVRFLRRCLRSTVTLYRRLVYQKLFLFWEKLGFHVTPATFGSTIPELRKLRTEVFSRQSALVGIHVNEASQLALLHEIEANYMDELKAFERPTMDPWDYCLYESSAFPPVDAQMLYCIVRKFKPRRYYEFGSGKSTCIAARSSLMNQRDTGGICELVAFEPYPSALLRSGFPGLTKLVEQRAEDIPLSCFEKMEKGDIIFIDSTHHMRIGSDANYLFLEVLPRLPKGVLVHVHDIFLPAEYPRLWITEWKVFPNEQYLFHAFLLHNSAWKIVWASHFMHLRHPDLLARVFAGYDHKSQGPGSIWIVRYSSPEPIDERARCML